jgi:nitronate monooxygenase
MRTRFTDLVGCAVPIQLAAMGGGVTGPALAVAVARAGALGMVGAADIPVEVLEAALQPAPRRTGTDRYVGAGFIVPFVDRGVVERVAPLAHVLEFFYGDPSASLVALGKDAGCLVSWQVGSVDEAKAAVDAGCDIVVAQGVEAGGHVRGRLGVLPLLDGVLAAVDVPVVAAGGVGTARGMAAALAAGADAVRVGTRFLAAVEATVHPDYLQALLAARAEDTVLTEAFSLFWPDAPHRVLRASLDALNALDTDESGATFADGTSVPRYIAMPPGASVGGRVDALPHYAGETVGAVRAVVPAADIVRELVDGAAALLRAAADLGTETPRIPE